MKKLKPTELRKNLFRLADEVGEGEEPIVLTRRGKKDIVLVSQAEWFRVKEKAAMYESATKTSKKKSMVGSLILKTKDLEGEIRKIRDDFARSLGYAPAQKK